MQELYFKNHLLIASPSLEDSVFSGAVMLICKHDEEGALGIIINRPTNIKMKDVYHQLSLLNDAHSHLPEMSPNAKYAHFGGPINSERGLVLHEKMGDWQYSINVNNYIDLTTSQDILKALASGRGPKRNVFVLGYAGWEPGQLEKEVSDNDWLTIPLSYHDKSDYAYQKHNLFQTEFSIIYDLLFATPAEMQWRKSLELLGISPETLSDQYGHA